MASPETALMQTIQLELTSDTGAARGRYRIPGLKLFRNNTGSLADGQGRWVKFGLVTGSADLIGWVSIKTAVASQENPGVWSVVPRAVFVALEVKVPGEKPTEVQLGFLQAVEAAGGVGIWATSVEEAHRKIAGYIIQT